MSITTNFVTFDHLWFRIFNVSILETCHHAANGNHVSHKNQVLQLQSPQLQALQLHTPQLKAVELWAVELWAVELWAVELWAPQLKAPHAAHGFFSVKKKKPCAAWDQTKTRHNYVKLWAVDIQKVQPFSIIWKNSKDLIIWKNSKDPILYIWKISSLKSDQDDHLKVIKRIT